MKMQTSTAVVGTTSGHKRNQSSNIDVGDWYYLFHVPKKLNGSFSPMQRSYFAGLKWYFLRGKGGL